VDNADADIYEELGISDWPEVLDRDAAVESIVAFYGILGNTDYVDLIITSDFEDQVKAHLEPAWAAVFTQDRGPYGRCMAKTMTKDDGRQVVIADVHLFLKGQPSPEATMRHEALHALVHLRGESLNRSRETIADHDGLHPDMVALAGIAAEEYRVERAVKPGRDELWSSFEALCIAGHNAIHTAAIAYFHDHDVQAIWDTVMNAFGPLTVQAAYVAAWIDADDVQVPRLQNAALDQRMLGGPWRAVVAVLRTLPAADIETDRGALDAIVIEAAHRFDDWLNQIGFACEELPEGGSYFHVHEHEDWTTRGTVDPTPAV
jgi:hypothetical protein